MAWDFIIFGGTGIQGRICARDLIEQGYTVLLVGRDKDRVKELIKNRRADFIKFDLNNREGIEKMITGSGASVVINCAELNYNIDIMNACLKAKVNYTDLGGLQKITKEQFKFDKAFKKIQKTCITGCGSTPGIINVLTGYAVSMLDRVESIKLGFVWDSNIKKFVVPYSINSIIQEFTERPVVLKNGKFHKSNRFECRGTFNFKEIGKQTVYCIVHSEVYTFWKYFKKKGLKNVNYMAGFPEHSKEAIKSLVELDLMSEKNIIVNGKEIKPRDFTTQMLKRIETPRGYKETENLWSVVNGRKDGKNKTINIDCIVKTQKGWEDAGSNIDTGRTIAVISSMIKKGEISGNGVYSPEAIVPFEKFMREMKKRGIEIYINDKSI